MVEISNNYNNIVKTQNISQNKTNNINYATKNQDNYDKLDLSQKDNKKDNKNKLKLFIGGAIAAIGVIFIGIKTHKFIKNKKIKQIAETEAERLKNEAEEKAKKEAERLRIEAEKKAKIEAEEKARIKAEEKVKNEAEEKARIEAEEKARIEAEEKARIEAEEKARIEAEEKARIEAEEKAKIEAEEKARIESEKKTNIKPEEKAKVDTEVKTTGVQRPQNLARTINKGLDFGEDLSKLVEEQNATPEEIQKLVSKHFNTDKIYVHSMSEYNNFGPTGINKERKAATTRPTFNENGKLEKIDLFIPDLDYQNKENVIEYLDKTTHEFTHVAQFLSGNTSNLEYVYPTIEGRIFNYIQKNITDKMTDKMFEDTLIALVKESKEKIKNVSEINKFLDKPSNLVTKEHLGEILKLGKDKDTQKTKINEIFNFLYDTHIKQMIRDPNVYELMKKSGGYEGFRNKIKAICFNTFKNEQEAYKAGQMMRQKINGTTNQTTNNDLQNIIMEMCADALK